MLSNKESRTELANLGEYKLIKRLTDNFEIKSKHTIKGIGDDAAVIDNANMLTLTSTELFIEGIHFDLTYTPLKHLGYKIVVASMSDIIAMNGEPTQILIGLALSNRFSVEAIEELYSGIKTACLRYNIDIVGSDTTTSSVGMVISATAIGVSNSLDVVYRNSSNEKDLICVSGDFGASYMGLLLLEREKQVFKADPTMQPDLDGFDYILERQLKPELRIDIVNLLKNNNIKPTSMIDISDGLASDLLQICKSSNLGCNIYEEKIPIDSQTVTMAQEFNIDPTIAATNGGEDYELLFTISISDYEKVKLLPGISIIGNMENISDGEHIITSGGSVYPISAQAHKQD